MEAAAAACRSCSFAMPLVHMVSLCGWDGSTSFTLLLLLLCPDGAAPGRSEGGADGGAPGLGSGGAQRVLVAPRAPEACKKPADREARQKRVEKEAEAARRWVHGVLMDG
jgi:hypothetical protein